MTTSNSFLTASEIAKAFADAQTHHRAGRLELAEPLYRQIVDSDPDNPDGIYFLGVAAHQAGRLDEALSYFQRAVALEPQQSRGHAGIGHVLRAQGDPASAEAAYRTALALDQSDPVVWSNLGSALREQRRYEEAEACFGEAIRLWPDYPDAHDQLGAVLLAQGRGADAQASLQRALQLSPGNAGTLNNLALAYNQQERFGEAEVCLRAALRARPDFPEAANNLANLLQRRGAIADAENWYRRALQSDPAYIDAAGNLGNVLQFQGRFREAESAYRAALVHKPDNAGMLHNLGTALNALGRLDEAEASTRAALALKSDYAEALSSLSMTLLAAGKFEEGWRQFEQRWQVEPLRNHQRSFAQAQWRGETLAGRRLFLHAEQGFGDTIQFCRYIPLIEADATVILEVPPELVRLMGSLKRSVQIMPTGEVPPDFDLHCPLMSLPLAVQATVTTIPAAIPYLAADPVQISVWAERLRSLKGFRVGLVWAGGMRHGDTASIAVDGRRSMALRELAPLAQIPGVEFVSLQTGDPAQQTPPAALSLHDWTAELTNFADTAALIEGLDLVIGVDTAVVHLAGALGKPVWMFNRFDSCWRWQRARDDSPWYPTLTQFRHPAEGDWTSVIEEVKHRLATLAAAGNQN